MSKFIGRTADFGIAKETVRGTAENAATFYLPKMSVSIDDTTEKYVDENSIGVVEDSVDSVNVKKVAVGEFEGKIGDKSVGLLLLSALGSVSTSGPTDSAYTHTYNIGQSAQHQALTLFMEDANQDYKYALGMIDTLTIESLLGQYAVVRASFRSKIGATATLTPSYTAENHFLPKHGVFKLASTQAGLGGASAVNIRRVSVTFNNNLEDDDAIGSEQPVDILNKQFSISGSLEMVFDAETIKTLQLADTAQAMRIQLQNTDVTIGASTRPELRVDLHSVKFSNLRRNYNNNDVATISVDFTGHYKLADSRAITVVLVNTQASY